MRSPHVSVYARFNFKEHPSNYLGVTQEDWNIGKDKSVSFANLCYDLIVPLAEFYAATMTHITVEEMNHEMQLLSRYLMKLNYKEQEIEDIPE